MRQRRAGSRVIDRLEAEMVGRRGSDAQEELATEMGLVGVACSEASLSDWGM